MQLLPRQGCGHLDIASHLMQELLHAGPIVRDRMVPGHFLAQEAAEALGVLKMNCE
jgi:hypothetical protein